MSGFVVLEAGALATVQDLGRPGYGAMGVATAGAADRGAARLANRLVGNLEGAAVVEVTLGGFRARAEGDLVAAVTGAEAVVLVDRVVVGVNTRFRWAAGSTLTVRAPSAGLRSCLAVAGGVATEPVLGSRSRDTMSGLGPDPLGPGHRVAAGRALGEPPATDLAPLPPVPVAEVTLSVVRGPRDDWFTPQSWARLLGSRYEATSELDRVGVRLAGPELDRSRSGELPSEGMVRGALQVPPSGVPTIFLSDHPVTGGYPVIAVLTEACADRAAQLRPGQGVRFSERTAGARPRGPGPAGRTGAVGG